jgi:hypothetical protein
MVRVLCTNEWCARWTKLTPQTEAVPVSFLATVVTVLVVAVVAVAVLLTRPAPAVVPAEAAKRRLFFRSKRCAAERVSLTVADYVYKIKNAKCQYEACERV